MNLGIRGRGIAALSIVATVVATLVIGVALLFWIQASSGDHVFARTKEFSDLMRVVRPAILLLILFLWRPVFGLLHRRSIVTDRIHERALSSWPWLMVWTALIELTLGQGYVLFGLTSLVVYWIFLRLR